METAFLNILKKKNNVYFIHCLHFSKMPTKIPKVLNKNMELGINSKNIKCSSTLNLSLQIVMATLTFFETLDSIKFRTKKLCTFFVSTFQCYCYNILRKCVFKELDPSVFVFSAEQAVICPY